MQLKHLLSLSIFCLTSLFAQAQQVQLVKDINPNGNAEPMRLCNADGNLFFIANDGTSGNELWFSDGTEAGTTLLKNLYTNPNASNAVYFCIMNNKLYFISSKSPLFNTDIWATDGTANGSSIATSLSGQVSALYVVGNKLFFGFGGTGASASNKGLYTSDGTSAGTVRVKDLDLNVMLNFSTYGTGIAKNNTFYFVGNDGVNGDELWKSDGTEAGTVMVKDITAGSLSGLNFQSFLTNGYNNKFYFVAFDQTYKRRVWISDGTDAGTTVLDTPTAGCFSPQDLTSYNGYLFFCASSNTAFNGEELWYTDGTREGTKLFSDLYAGFNSSSPTEFCVANNTLFFRANTGSVGAVLYALSLNPINTGISMHKNNLLNVNPNPASTKIYVEHHQHTIEKNKQYELFSINGKLVQNGFLINNYVDVSELENGVYLLKVEEAFAKIVVSR